MLLLTCLLLLPGQPKTTDTTDFPKSLQVRALQSTVRVVNPAQKQEGSGVIVGKNGGFVYILTAYHIVKDADDLEVSLFLDARPAKVYSSAKLVAKAADIRDLALLRVAVADVMPGILPICPSAAIPRGEGFPVLMSGCATGLSPTCVPGKVAGRKKVSRKSGGESAYFWECPGTVAKGRSGGPLIDRQGQVIGICSGTSDGKGYFTHTDEIHRFLKQNVFEWLVKAPG